MAAKNDAADLANEIDALRRMTAKELRWRHVELFGEETRAGNRQYLFRRIAWRLQSLAEGDLSERARRRAAELACDADIRMSIPPPPKASPGAAQRTVETPARFTRDERIPPGGRLVRVYRGETHLVKVLASSTTAGRSNCSARSRKRSPGRIAPADRPSLQPSGWRCRPRRFRAGREVC